jgi:UDP-glucose 4-epimerase
MNKYLVTGGAGFIGSHLVDKLVAMGDSVTVIDNLSSGKRENLNPGAIFYDTDVCDYEKIAPLFEGMDCVFHLAAIPRVPISVKDPVATSKVNILGTVSVFKAAIDKKVKRIVFISSSSVYGNQEKLPFKEDMVPEPISPYALHKLAGENFAGLFTKLYGVPIVSLRYFNVYGPRIDSASDYGLVIGKFIKAKREGKPLTVFGDGSQTRSFCYVEDTVAATIKAAQSDKIKGGEVINVGSEKSYSINYLAKLIGGPVEYLPPRLGDAFHTQADIALAKNLLGWEPKVAFEEGISKVQEWFGV